MDSRQKLSAAIITFNEEHRIRAALESVKWADEIVVVDSLSTDNTVAICREYTDRVYQIPWHGHVRQKQIATDYTTHHWVLSLDADERVSSELAQEIQEVLRGAPPHVGYFMPRKTLYLGEWIHHCGWYPDYKLRLFDKRRGAWAGENPHDRVEVHGSSAYFRHDLLHYSYKDISHHVQVMNSYSSIAASHQKRRISGGEIFFRTVFAFFKKYIIKQGFRDGSRGMVVCLLSAFTTSLKYAKVLEAHLAPSPPEEESDKE